MGTEVRGVQSHREWLEVLDVLDRAFTETPYTYFERHLFYDPTLEYSHTRILLEGGRIVSTVQIFPRTLYYKGQQIPFGGLGNVGTDPAYRRRGYASRLVRDAIAQMKSQGFPLSLLFTGINPFYEHFGYVTVPRTRYILRAHQLSYPTNSVRVFDRHRDFQKVQRIYEHFNRNRIGPVVRDETYWKALFRLVDESPDLFLVLEEKGEVVAYIRSKITGHAVHILEFGAYLREAECFEKLATAALQRGHRQEAHILFPDVASYKTCLSFEVGEQTDQELMIALLDPEYFTCFGSFKGMTEKDWICQLFPGRTGSGCLSVCPATRDGGADPGPLSPCDYLTFWIPDYF